VITVKRLCVLLASLLFSLMITMTGCAPLEKRVELSYANVVGASGGSGEIFLMQPMEK
jgi:hypothetical protein